MAVPKPKPNIREYCATSAGQQKLTLGGPLITTMTIGATEKSAN
jgi:hypothetical protein